MESADTAALTSTPLEQRRPVLSQSSYQEGPPSLGHFVLDGEATTSCVQEAIVHGGCERFCPSRQV